MKPYPSVYIAGPDVFLLEAKAFYAAAVSLCEELGLTALHPYQPQLLKEDQIFEHNLKCLRDCAGVVAHVEPFRGAEPDSGTSFEMGFARALNKPVVAYLTNNNEVFDKVHDYYLSMGGGSRRYVSPFMDPDSNYVFPDGMTAECWGYPLNLMLQKGSKEVVIGNMRDALVRMKEILYAHE